MSLIEPWACFLCYLRGNSARSSLYFRKCICTLLHTITHNIFKKDKHCCLTGLQSSTVPLGHLWCLTGPMNWKNPGQLWFAFSEMNLDTVLSPEPHSTIWQKEFADERLQVNHRFLFFVTLTALFSFFGFEHSVSKINITLQFCMKRDQSMQLPSYDYLVLSLAPAFVSMLCACRRA